MLNLTKKIICGEVLLRDLIFKKSSMNKKTVAVTGGNGFLASHVIEELKIKGYHVITNIRSINTDLFVEEHLFGVDVYPIDNRDQAGIRSIVEKCDGVINLAGILGTKIKALSDLDVFIDNNIKGSLSVIKATEAFKTPMVQIAVGNYFEHNWYSLTKTFVEGVCIALAKSMGFKINIVRGLNLIGERQKILNTGKIAPTFITKALKNEPIQVYGGKDKCGIMDCLYVKDAAKILVEVLEKTMDGSVGYGNVFEAGTGKGYSVYEIAEMVIEYTGSKSVIEEVPMRAGESERSQVIAKNPYPFRYTSLPTTLKKTIKYYKELDEENERD